MNTEELLDRIYEAYNEAPPASFASVEDALKVVGTSLKWLTDQCEDEEDGSEIEITD